MQPLPPLAALLGLGSGSGMSLLPCFLSRQREGEYKCLTLSYQFLSPLARLSFPR